MKNITVRLDEEMIEELEQEADEHGRTRSEHIRTTLATRHEHNEHADEQKRRIEDLERENERLRNEKRLIVEQREEHTELVNAVKEERSLAKRKANASVLTRAKWWLVGMGGEE